MHPAAMHKLKVESRHVTQQYLQLFITDQQFNQAEQLLPTHILDTTIPSRTTDTTLEIKVTDLNIRYGRSQSARPVDQSVASVNDASLVHSYESFRNSTAQFLQEPSIFTAQ
jgi:hypothetical protein